MIRNLYWRLRCRAGLHHPLACAGSQDHHWTWDTTRSRWTARLDAGYRPPVRPVADLPRTGRTPGTTSHRVAGQ